MGQSTTSALGLLQLSLFGSILYIVTCELVVIEYTCFGYRLQDGDKTYDIRCNSTEVFSPTLKKCLVPQNNDWPCDVKLECNSTDYHKYPDVKEGCNTYYTCLDGVFLGHNYCPGGLVFNEVEQYCDWEYNVAPPCGTADIVLG